MHAMSFAPLPDAQIKQHTAGGSFERGTRYFEEDAVEEIEVHGGELEAHVRGSEPIPYVVIVERDGAEGPIEHVSCTCPYHEGSWCKHIVAALLAYRRDTENGARDARDIRALLADADREALVALVERLAERDARVTDWVEAWANDEKVSSVPTPSARS